MARTSPETLALPPLDRSSSKPLYRQVYEGYRSAISERRLRPGDRLPSTRSLALELGISRLPVLNAFEQLVAEGYCESRTGSGTAVARALPEELLGRRPAVNATNSAAGGEQRSSSEVSGRLLRAPRPWLVNAGPFRIGEIAIERFPLSAWASLMARHSRELTPSQLQYGDPAGYPPLREAIASYLRTARSARCEAEQVIIVSGSQQAITIAIRALLDPGHRVWVEEPGYWGVRDALVASGAELVPVQVDAEGLDVAWGEANAPSARAAFVTPSHQMPLGATMSATRRLQLLDWAHRRGAWVVEDDYDSEFRFETFPIAALQGLDRDARVIYVGTFSKVVFPAIRLAYLVVPPDLVARFVAVRRAQDICPPISTQAVLAEFMRTGQFARHLRRMRLLYGERRRALVDALRSELDERFEIVGEQAGTHLVLLLPDGIDDRAFAERAAAERLWLMPLSERYFAAPQRRGLVLGYGGTAVETIPGAVRHLRALLESSAL